MHHRLAVRSAQDASHRRIDRLVGLAVEQPEEIAITLAKARDFYRAITNSRSRAKCSSGDLQSRPEPTGFSR